MGVVGALLNRVLVYLNGNTYRTFCLGRVHKLFGLVIVVVVEYRVGPRFAKFSGNI